MTNSESFIINDFYRAGGSLPLGIPSYIKRKADDDLYNGIKSGQFCYALAARQMGKSSLRLRVMDRIIREGYICSCIDITKIGRENMSSDEWYYSFVDIIHTDLVLDIDIGSWWEKERKVSPVYRFYKFIKEIVIEKTSKPIVFFIDEIDSMLSLNRIQFSTDDFFASIRAFYNERGDNHELTRINFVILGVASPTDLMNDASRTPFNIGKPIMLDNLKFDEAISLKDGLKELPYASEELLKEVFYWTNGQPVLTQQVCESLVLAEITSLPIKLFVEEQVKNIFINRSISENINLLNIQKRISENDKWSVRMLQIYETILTNGNCVEEPGDRAQIYLKLNGLIRSVNDTLYVNNKIYESKLNKQWIKNLREIIIRPFYSVLNEWVANNKSVKKCLRGKSLIEYEEWCNQREDLTHLENEFLTFSKTIKERNRINRKSYILAISVFIIAITLLLYYQNILDSIQREIDSAKIANNFLTQSNNSFKKRNDTLTKSNNSLSIINDNIIKQNYILHNQGKELEESIKQREELVNSLKQSQIELNLKNDTLINITAELEPKIDALEFYYNSIVNEEWIEAFDKADRSIIKEEFSSIDTNLRPDYVKALKHLSFARTTKDFDANKALWHISEASRLLVNNEIFTKELYSISQNYIFYNCDFKLTKSLNSIGNSYENNNLEVGQIINDSLILILGYEYNKSVRNDKTIHYRSNLNLFEFCDYRKDTIIFRFTSPRVQFLVNYREAKVVFMWDSTTNFKRRHNLTYSFMQIFDYKNNNLRKRIMLNDIISQIDTFSFYKYKLFYQDNDVFTLYDAASRTLFKTIDLEQNKITNTLKRKVIEEKIDNDFPGLNDNTINDKFYQKENLNYFVYINYNWNEIHSYRDTAYIFLVDFKNNIILLDEKKESNILYTKGIAVEDKIELLDSSIIIYTKDSLYLEEYNLEGNLINVIYTSDKKVIFRKSTDQFYFWKDYCLIENQFPLRMPLYHNNRRIINHKILWEKNNIIFTTNLDSIEVEFKEQLKRYVDPFRREFEKDPFNQLVQTYQIQSKPPELKSGLDESY